MKLTVIGSSSKGNAYVLQNASEALLLEAGMPFKKSLAAVGYDLGKIQGCLITHEHGDHARYAREYLDNGVRVMASEGTCALLGRSRVREPLPLPLHQMRYSKAQLGGFHIAPFRVEHDAAEPLGYAIWHQDMGTLLFATDTAYLPNPIARMSQVMLECNYSEPWLETALEGGLIQKGRYDHVRNGHMSLETCLDTLERSDLSGVRNIVLIHISGDHGEARTFTDAIARATGKRVAAALPDTEIELSTPF